MYCYQIKGKSQHEGQIKTIQPFKAHIKFTYTGKSHTIYTTQSKTIWTMLHCIDNLQTNN